MEVTCNLQMAEKNHFSASSYFMFSLLYPLLWNLLYVFFCVILIYINDLCFVVRQEQCNVLVELMREYQTLKTSISSIIESTEPLVDISSVLKDHEETRRSLTKVS